MFSRIKCRNEIPRLTKFSACGALALRMAGAGMPEHRWIKADLRVSGPQGWPINYGSQQRAYKVLQ